MTPPENRLRTVAATCELTDLPIEITLTVECPVRGFDLEGIRVGQGLLTVSDKKKQQLNA